MTTTEAKQIIANEIAAWTNEFAAGYIADSIHGSGDAELERALSLVGANFDWFAEVKTSS